MTIKTRFAPSPTGFMHLGNARTALFNALFAYQHHGVFLLRIEDTDIERSTSEFAQQLMQDLRWLGLEWQEGADIGGSQSPYYQSQRSEVYAEYYNKLAELGQVYPCFCTPTELALSRKIQLASGKPPRYAGTCSHLSPTEIEKKLEKGLQPTLRFRVPTGQKVEFQDLVKGAQCFASDDIGDFIIRRADGTSAFFFCNAIDDALMGVTHAFRGDDHLANTPRQIMMLQRLGLPIPQYGHFAMILGHNGSPLSKRNGSLSIKDLAGEGWLADSVINYMARLGHTYSEDKFMTLEELANNFSTERLGKAPARFDAQQMKHWQQVAVGRSSDEELWAWMADSVHVLVPPAQQAAFVAAVRPNVVYPSDALHYAKLLFSDEFSLHAEASAVIAEAGNAFFQQALVALTDSQADYKALVNQLKQSSGLKGKALFMPLRAALTGETHGPEMANLLPLMGIERAQHRLQQAFESFQA